MHRLLPCALTVAVPRRLGAALPTLLTALFALLVLSGCSTAYSPRGMAPGTSTAAAMESLGVPSGRFELPQGGQRLEFARGPYGKHTYMLDFDRQGGLASWTQVLTEDRFNAILAGMTQDEVLMRIGHPSEQSTLPRQKQIVWSYRYEAQFCQWFQIGLSQQGRVIDTGYYPDPMCDVGDRSDDLR